MVKKVISWLVLGVCTSAALSAQTTVLYETKFELSEGYDPQLDLAGQRGWLIDGSGGNGLLNEFFPGFGQQAYIGFTPPAAGTVTSVWRPVNFNPVPAGNPIVHFSTKMQVVQSTQGGDDDFRWSVYNSAGNRLFGLSFETGTQEIWFQNEDLVFRPTGWSFDFDGTYDLHIWMDFQRNSWTALLNDLVLVNSQPIATNTATARDLGDVDAVWFINNSNGVGNNFMLFDNYRVTAETLKAIPAILEPIGPTTEGYFRFYIHGQPNVRYSVDVTTDFEQWDSLGEFSDPDGTFVFEDTTAIDFPRGFYRLREIIP